MFFRSLNINKKGKRGFTLIELAIVLAVTSLLTVGLWRMMASGNTQLRDQAAADQQKELIASVRAYLATSQGQGYVTSVAAPNTLPLLFTCPATYDEFCNFLPNGFDENTTNSYGQTYEIRVKRDTEESYSFMIKTKDGDVIPDSSGGRISSLIGADGGFVYTADICGNAGKRACGAFGSWDSHPDTAYGYGTAPTVVSAGGQVASRTFIGGTAELNTPWLARVDLPGDTSNILGSVDEFNVVKTDIAFATTDTNGDGDGVNIILNGNDISGGVVGGAIYGGGIFNIEEVVLGTSASDTTPLEINGACSVTEGVGLTWHDTIVVADRDPWMNDANFCAASLTVNTGDVQINGKLYGKEVFGAKYIYTTSDRRLKKDITPIEGALDKLSKVKSYQFTRKDTGETKYGVIAQEVEKVFPTLIAPIDNNYKGVDYMGFIGPLIAAVNELRKENEVLRSEMESLKKSISK